MVHDIQEIYSSVLLHFRQPVKHKYLILCKKLFESICIEIKSTLRKNISWHSNFTFQTLTSTQMINTNVFNDDIFFINISMKFENHRMQSTFILLLFYQERELQQKNLKTLARALKSFTIYTTLFYKNWVLFNQQL